MQHVRRVIPRLDISLLPERTSSMKQADLRGMLGKVTINFRFVVVVTINVCTSTVLMTPDILSHNPLKTLEDTKEHPDDPN
jgi:hypothetical protein